MISCFKLCQVLFLMFHLKWRFEYFSSNVPADKDTILRMLSSAPDNIRQDATTEATNDRK